MHKILEYIIFIWIVIGVSNTIIAIIRFYQIRKRLNIPRKKKGNFLLNIFFSAICLVIVSILWPLWDNSEESIQKLIEDDNRKNLD